MTYDNYLKLKPTAEITHIMKTIQNVAFFGGKLVETSMEPLISL